MAIAGADWTQKGIAIALLPLFTECRRKAPGFSHGEVQRPWENWRLKRG